MILKVAMPGKVQFKLIRREPAFFMAHEGDIHYIGGADVLPAPLETEQENEVIQDLATEEYAQEARSILIEHNLRLVVYIAKKFDNTGVGVEDLISIGTIGLIKSINTFNPGKNIKLATYASRCIENEILMYLRRNHKTRMEVSIDEPLNVDWDGNELLLSDILGTDEDVIYRDMENEAERRILRNAVAKLSERERTIVSLRFGLDTPDGQEMTQKEVAAYLGISQSYISRLEKKIMKRLVGTASSVTTLSVSAAAFSVPVVSLLSVAATAESVSGTGVVSVAAEPHAHNAADNPSARQNKLVFFIYHSPEYFSFLKRLNQPSLNIVLPQAVKIQPFSAFITILLQIYGLILQQMQFYRKFHNHTASGNSEQFFFRHDAKF